MTLSVLDIAVVVAGNIALLVLQGLDHSVVSSSSSSSSAEVEPVAIYLLRKFPDCFIVALFLLCVVVPVLMLWGMHITLICRGITTNEKIKFAHSPHTHTFSLQQPHAPFQIPTTGRFLRDIATVRTRVCGAGSSTHWHCAAARHHQPWTGAAVCSTRRRQRSARCSSSDESSSAPSANRRASSASSSFPPQTVPECVLFSLLVHSLCVWRSTESKRLVCVCVHVFCCVHVL